MVEMPERMGRLRIWYPEVPSTMDVAAGLAATGAPHGTLVEADYQTAGRGRRGHAWQTRQTGALLTSWILCPAGMPRNLAVLSPLVALSLIRVVHKVAPEAPAGFKWPNDVLIDGRKVAGILLTSRVQHDRAWIVAGVGVNVGRASVPDAVAGTSIAEWQPDATNAGIRAALAGELEQIWARYQATPALSNGDREELDALLVWRDEPVEVRTGQGPVVGCPVGVGRDGSLRLRDDTIQAEVALQAGEIVRGPRKTGAGALDAYRILP